MTRVFVVGDDVTATGLKMAGMKDSQAATPDTVGSVLDSMEEAEIIVITHSLYQSVKKRVDRMKEKIVIEIPDAKGGGEDVVNKIIRDVIGFEIVKG